MKVSLAGRGGAGVMVLIAAGLAGCRQEPVAPMDVVAMVDHIELRYSQFESYVERNVGETEMVLSSQVLTRLFDQFMSEELLRRLAIEGGLVPEAADSRQAIDALLSQGTGVTVSDSEVAAYYDAHQEEFARPERVRLRQILVEDRKTAEEAARELQAGEDFTAVAGRLARSSPAMFGGDQGELSREDLPPIFADTIFSLEEGEVSDIVPAEYGYHIFQVVDRFTAEQVPLEQAAPEIHQRLLRRRADSYLTGLVEKAQGRYNARVFARNLPFNYQGRYGGESGN